MQNYDLDAMNARIQEDSGKIQQILDEAGKIIVGQRTLLERLVIGLLCNGHILLEGVPGLAKTTAIDVLARTIDASFQRIQFTPDLLPADLIGTLIYDQQKAEFYTNLGPIFANVVLADEINRAPAKVQSALLEAMQERQVTIGDTTHALDDPFLVLATQNPIEHEGTYPLPEAQVDRFMLKVKVNYPSRTEELQILRRMTVEKIPKVKKVVSCEDVIRFRELTREIYMAEPLENYIVDLVCATRTPDAYQLGDLSTLIEYGASPRATIFLALAARAHAFLSERGYVTPEDIQAIGMDVLRHRVILSYEAEAEGIDAETIITQLFSKIEVP
ncbi:MoxR family ATPase [Candidatus Poribacteria bacterium]|nr:MoxR family ATPase [Candidatus Poribacteria bacterium]MYB65605.1 MoxR family ATPase [Candidatus Poribacteria bacterium]MYI94689.1 MoxR family ATPase [Candidatus Poribacteria bacterium]